MSKNFLLVFSGLAILTICALMFQTMLCSIESFEEETVVYLVETNAQIQKDIETKRLINVDNKWLYSANVGTEGYKTVSHQYANVITEATSNAYSLNTPRATIAANVPQE